MADKRAKKHRAAQKSVAPETAETEEKSVRATSEAIPLRPRQRAASRAVPVRELDSKPRESWQEQLQGKPQAKRAPKAQAPDRGMVQVMELALLQALPRCS